MYMYIYMYVYMYIYNYIYVFFCSRRNEAPTVLRPSMNSDGNSPLMGKKTM